MRKIILFSGLGVLLFGIFAGVLLGEIYDPNNIILGKSVNPTEQRLGGYKFISPLLECDQSAVSSQINGLDPLHDKIEQQIMNFKQEGTINDAAVYFRDLSNGPWFGVNEHASFSPASLLKLPVMMAYFKKAESDSSILNKKIKYEGKDETLFQNIRPTDAIEIGKTYTVDDLIERMIIYSDNASLTLLEDNIEPVLIDKVTLDLGVETANEKTPEDYMSVKGYAGLFRILYNASYLEKRLSEKALDILSRTEFAKGLVTGVPKSIKISHKFGERELPGGVKQLHDCGIIYNPKSPYLLCIMTRGSDYDKLASVISQISKIIYEDIHSKIK
jgi:beta-lactamase class A